MQLSLTQWYFTQSEYTVYMWIVGVFPVKINDGRSFGREI